MSGFRGKALGIQTLYLNPACFPVFLSQMRPWKAAFPHFFNASFGMPRDR